MTKQYTIFNDGDYGVLFDGERFVNFDEIGDIEVWLAEQVANYVDVPMFDYDEDPPKTFDANLARQLNER